MREYKFRAWIRKFSPVHDQMYYFRWHQIMELGTLHVRDEDGNFHMLCLGCDEEGEEGHPIIMQYTGLKDKNGKEIYEGDIVKTGAGNFRKYEIVKYEDGGFFPFSIAGFEITADADLTEVIGNIYENLELIKGE